MNRNREPENPPPVDVVSYFYTEQSAFHLITMLYTDLFSYLWTFQVQDNHEIVYEVEEINVDKLNNIPVVNIAEISQSTVEGLYLCHFNCFI